MKRTCRAAGSCIIWLLRGVFVAAPATPSVTSSRVVSGSSNLTCLVHEKKRGKILRTRPPLFPGSNLHESNGMGATHSLFLSLHPFDRDPLPLIAVLVRDIWGMKLIRAGHFTHFPFLGPIDATFRSNNMSIDRDFHFDMK